MKKMVIPCFTFFTLSIFDHLRDCVALQLIVFISSLIFYFYFVFISFSLYSRFHALWDA